ncbi:MAG: M81 family metallopeptidase [Gammaproteobacteria bacterium]|nr:M81 family metallopeptidase [Gammaproteobacteria bacterium]
MTTARRTVLMLLALAAVGASLPGAAALAADKPINASKPVRIAVIYFVHETVTFLPYDTKLEDFIYEGSPARGEALLSSGPMTAMGGFVKVAREHANVELVGIESPLMPKTGSASGWIDKTTYDHFVNKMISELKAQGPFDGVYLSLHGAMGVRDVAKPEAELARRVREVIGPKGYIAGTFDPHGNEDDDFLRYADLAFCVKYYPHYDYPLQGERAARTLIRAIRGDYKPTTATRKPPIITPSVLQWTGTSPWMDLVQRALVWEAREPDVYVSFYYGFAFMDSAEAGMAFQVMTNGDPELAEHIADDLANTAWRLRKELVYGTKVYRINEGVGLAKEAVKQGKAPVVLADHSDRSGAATWLLKQVIDQKLSNVLIATVADFDAIEALRKKGVKPGDPFDMMIGGRLDVSAGEPVRIEGTVNTVSGAPSRRGGAAGSGGQQLWVSVKFGDGNVVIISPFLHQNTDPQAFLEIGINADDFDVIAIKSRVHFRRGYYDTGYAKTILLVEPDEPFVGTVRLEALKYQQLKLENFYPYGKNLSYP